MPQTCCGHSDFQLDSTIDGSNHGGVMIDDHTRRSVLNDVERSITSHGLSGLILGGSGV
jgi:hypothetical protein